MNDFGLNYTIMTQLLPKALIIIFLASFSDKDKAKIHFREREEKGWSSIYDRSMLKNFLFFQPEV